MARAILRPSEMAEVDRLAAAAGPFDSYRLMLNAGHAVAAAVLDRFASASRVHVLCGPGNNGGDGYVAARLLSQAGVAVSVWRSGIPRAGSDAARASAECPVAAGDISGLAIAPGSLVVDALFGAGLARPVDSTVAEAIDRVAASGAPVLAVDLPSGVFGESGHVDAKAVRADATITFCRKKPGHVLYPGRAYCGAVTVADIGIDDAAVDATGPTIFENDIAFWLRSFPAPAVDAHKYSRGHVGVFSGGPAQTGAARLAAMAAARAGAGAVTVLSPANALSANAAHLTSIMLARAETAEDVEAFVTERKPSALVFGPGLGPHAKVGRFLVDLMPALSGRVTALVVDASAITSLALDPSGFLEAARADGCPAIVLTPHSGEFGRLFPDIAEDRMLSKIDRARAAAVRANAVVVLKGADTVIAAPSGRAAVNTNGTPLLATAGSGDVLSGIIAALAAQGMAAFEAACAAVWLHAEAANRFGAGLIAEDLPAATIPVLRDILSIQSLARSHA